MKKNLLKIIGAMVFGIAVVGAMTFQLASAQKETDGQTYEAGKATNGGGGRFDGTWDVAVTIRNCQNNAPIRTFASVTTFMFGGTLIDSTSGVPQSRKTPGHGAWRHAGGNEYHFSFKVFNFDAAGNYAGWQIVRQTAYLDSPRDEYFSRGTTEFYDPAGNLISNGCSTTTATRFE
jgi:hypothetical protein